MWLIILGILVAVALAIAFSRKDTSAWRESVPQGVYLNAISKGATPQAAIFDAVQVLRYRAPWNVLSDEDLRVSAEVLAQLPDPSYFTQVMSVVEESGDLAHFTNLDSLNRFVEFMKQTPE